MPHEKTQDIQKGRTRHLLVRIRSNDGQTTSGELSVQEWNKRERLLRAAKFGGLCWGASLFSIIIPLLHFILVPAFFIAGPIIVYFVLAQEAVILGGSGTCPYCQKPIKIVRNIYRFPLSEMCEHCQQGVKIEIA